MKSKAEVVGTVVYIEHDGVVYATFDRGAQHLLVGCVCKALLADKADELAWAEMMERLVIARVKVEEGEHSVVTGSLKRADLKPASLSDMDPIGSA